MAKHRHNSFCAFCRSPRKIPTKKSVGIFHILITLVVSGATMLAVWGGLDARVIGFYVFFLAVAEIFLRFRWRLAIVCQQCGFDPVLYRKNIQTAVQKVRQRLDQRRLSPMGMMSRRLDLPTISPERSQELERAATRQSVAKSARGHLLSRSV